jgi:hypothetical protein
MMAIGANIANPDLQIGDPWDREEYHPLRRAILSR